MDYETLRKANATIKTVPIKGKQYAEVNERIRVFRMLFPNGRISTELHSNENGMCIFKATVTDGDGHILGTGHAYEREGKGMINSTSYIENCETSAVGRALAMCGIGIDTSIASYEEVDNAIQQQDEKVKKTSEPASKSQNAQDVPTTKEEREAFASFVQKNGYDLQEVCSRFHITKKSTKSDLQEVINRIAIQRLNNASNT